MTAVLDINPIDRDEMVGRATTEYARVSDLLASLSDDDWAKPTTGEEWDVRLMVAHPLGAAESNASILESLRQVRRGRKLAKEMGRPEIDGINAVQVEARKDLTPNQLTKRLASVARKAVKGRHRMPRPLRKVKIANPVGGTMTMGHLVDVVYTRDQWMHRIDIARAIGVDPLITADHDARIVEDVVAEWATVQPGPFTLELIGPAGGTFTSGNDGDLYRFDAVEFCLIVSGRSQSDADLAKVVF